MALPYPIDPTQTDAKSPIDQQLMDAIRLNQEDLDFRLSSQSAGGIVNFRVNGSLIRIRETLNLGSGKHLDGCIISNEAEFTKGKLYLERGAESGALEVDVKRHRELQHPIESIESLMTEAIASYDVLGSPLSTLSVSREASDISTQQINRVKPTLNIESIKALSDGNSLYTFSGTTPLDADYKVGETIQISGASNGVNDGTFIILAINVDGLPSILINNPSAVDQDTPAGSIELDFFEYVYNSSVDPNFAEGESVLMSSHSTGANNGIKAIERTNDGGNNILVYVPNGATQGAPAGSGVCLRMRYTFASPVDVENYVVGELADFGGHSSANNNGNYVIKGVNVSGNNVIILNDVTSGAIQAGAGGTANTRRQIIGLATDPDTLIEVGDFINVSGRSGIHPTQDGNFEVKLVKKFGANNVVIYLGTNNNSSGAGGTLRSSRKLVKFREDFNTSYTVDESTVALEGLFQSDPVEEFLVKEINRGGFSNYNIIIDAVDLADESATSGRVAREIQSIFTQRPRLEFTAETPRKLQFDDTATFKAGGVINQDILSMDILEVPAGLPSTMVLSLS